MSRALRPLRTRTLGKPRHLACGCHGRTGQEVVQTAKGRPWTCWAHCQAEVREFEPRRGPVTVAAVLADTARRP